MLRASDPLLDSVAGSPMYSAGRSVNRWAVKFWMKFWTDASSVACHSGMAVRVQVSSSGTVGAAQLRVSPYTDGVVVIERNIYEDWFVVLQGRDKSSWNQTARY